MTEDKYLYLEIEEEEEEEVKEKSQEETQETQEETSEEEAKSWQELAGVDPKDFDRPEKLANSYKEARTRLSQQGEEIKVYKQHTERVIPILKTIQDNPEIKEMIERKLNGESVEQPKGDKQKQDETQLKPDPRVDDLYANQRDEAIGDIEKSFGINHMTEEEARKARLSVGNEIRDLGIDLSTADLNRLRRVMNKAYELAGYKRQDTNQTSAGFGSIRSSAGFSGAKLTPDNLTPEQKKAAEGMGISYADYAKNLQEIQG